MLFLSGYPATIPLHPQGTEGRSPHIFRTRARDAEDLRQTTGGSAPETPRTSATRLPFRLFPAHEDNVSVPTSSSRRVLRPLSLFRACEDNVSTPTSSSRMIPTRAAATSSPPTAGWRQRCRQRCRGRGGSGKCGQAGRGFKPEEGLLPQICGRPWPHEWEGPAPSGVGGTSEAKDLRSSLSFGEKCNLAFGVISSRAILYLRWLSILPEVLCWRCPGFRGTTVRN